MCCLKWLCLGWVFVLSGCAVLPPDKYTLVTADYGQRPTKGVVYAALAELGALPGDWEGGYAVRGYAVDRWGLYWIYGWVATVECKGPEEPLGYARYQPTERWRLLLQGDRVVAAWVQKGGGWEWRVI